jgi:AcrR family transcriptional regulator
MNTISKSRASVHPLRTRLREETGKAILEAAEQAIGELGFAAARIEDVASRAGVSVGTVYNHFDDRDALIEALVTRRREELAERMDEALQRSASAGFAVQLETFVRALLEHFEAHRAFLSALLEGEHARTRAPIGPRGARPNAAMLEVYRRAEKVVDRGRAEGSLREAGSELFAVYLVGALRGALLRELYEPRGVPLADRAPEIVRFFLQGARG